MHTVDEETSKKDTQDYELCSISNVKRGKELGPRQSRPQEAYLGKQEIWSKFFLGR